MVRSETDVCPKCGGELRYYDYVIRIQKFPEGKNRKILLSRMRCMNCKSVHRVIPNDILPYKQYAKNIVEMDGEYLDFPSDSTVKRWAREKRKCSNEDD